MGQSGVPPARLVAVEKSRGAFFTPPEIALYLTQWAVRNATDRVLEPSCGEAAFLLTAAERLDSLGTSTADVTRALSGMDVHPESVKAAKRLLAKQGFSATLQTGDFFLRPPEAVFDAVIGNPPYVRYQSFAGSGRDAARNAALAQGVRLNQLASSWAAFTVHASGFLKPGGRLALVLPAELLAVKYAAEIRRFLLSRFGSVRIVLFDNLVFPGVLEEVVLLLAEGSGGAKSFEVYQARTVDDLGKIVAANWVGYTPKSDEKWTAALLPTDAAGLYEELRADSRLETLLDWGETYLGAVTGNNDFFAINDATREQHRLTEKELLRISPPGSKHLRGLEFSPDSWRRLRDAGERCYLFAPGTEPSKAARAYIVAGEREGVHEAYKCRVRSPWWRVPMPQNPDLLFTYMNHDRPRVVGNRARLCVLNSVYGVRLRKERAQTGRDLLPLAMLNSLTLLGAEIVGRSYGGGLLKHEPKEADRLPVPSLTVLQDAAAALKPLKPQIARLVLNNDGVTATALVDGVILREQLGLTEKQIAGVQMARRMLFERRAMRGKSS